MTVKHQPATPLPWHSIGAAPTHCIMARDEASFFDVAYATPINEDEDPRASAKQNGDYIAHACNSYQKLVERTERAPMLAWDPSAFVGFSDEQIAMIKRGWDVALQRVYEGNRALLLEVGEA